MQTMGKNRGIRLFPAQVAKGASPLPQWSKTPKAIISKRHINHLWSRSSKLSLCHTRSPSDFFLMSITMRTIMIGIRISGYSSSKKRGQSTLKMVSY